MIDEDADELTQLESQNISGPMSIAATRCVLRPDDLRFFAGATRTLKSRAAADVRRGLHLDQPWQLGYHAPDHALEPADDGDLEDRPGARDGDVQILKPAGQTSLHARFVELAQEVLPPSVLQVITGEATPRARRWFATTRSG